MNPDMLSTLDVNDPTLPNDIISEDEDIAEIPLIEEFNPVSRRFGIADLWNIHRRAKTFKIHRRIN